ncbi:MAG: hypothetical protein ACRCWQ_03415, partial [Bacilli bacterium]
VMKVFNYGDFEREQVVTASKIADTNKMTRSVFVNTLNKLSVAGIVNSQSLGMKGTHVKVNDMKALEDVIEKIKQHA